MLSRHLAPNHGSWNSPFHCPVFQAFLPPGLPPPFQASLLSCVAKPAQGTRSWQKVHVNEATLKGRPWVSCWRTELLVPSGPHPKPRGGGQKGALGLPTSKASQPPGQIQALPFPTSPHSSKLPAMAFTEK